MRHYPARGLYWILQFFVGGLCLTEMKYSLRTEEIGNYNPLITQGVEPNSISNEYHVSESSCVFTGGKGEKAARIDISS